MSCCEKWTEATGSVISVGPAAIAYGGSTISAQVEKQEDGKFSVNGCCGGQCYVLTDIAYCPWCGAKAE